MSSDFICRICGFIDDSSEGWTELNLCANCVDYRNMKKAIVRAEFADRLGSGHIATFETWLTPGNEADELQVICLQALDEKGFKEVELQEIKFDYA